MYKHTLPNQWNLASLNFQGADFTSDDAASAIGIIVAFSMNLGYLDIRNQTGTRQVAVEFTPNAKLVYGQMMGHTVVSDK